MTTADGARTFTRVPVRLSAEITTDDGSRVRGAVRDISMVGVALESEHTVPAGVTCALQVELETGTQPVIVAGRGEVLRAADGLIAVRIDTLDADGYQHLQKLVLYNARNATQVERELTDHADRAPTLAPPRSRRG